MPKKVVNESDNVYLQARNKLNISREAASEMIGISASTLKGIENGTSFPGPDVVYAMSKAYREPELCNYYCSMECPIGMKYVHKVQTKDLTKITLETIDAMNSVNEKIKHFVSITKDGEVSEDELREFISMQIDLERVSKSVLALQFWTREMIAEGVFSKADYERIIKEEIEAPKKKKRRAGYQPID